MIRAFMEERLIVYLMQLKITPNLKGYAYIKEAVMRVCENSEKKHNMSTNLFKELAEHFGNKVSLLDRSLRHAIEVSYKRGGIEEFERVMDINISSHKPSVKEVICMLAEKLRLDLYRAFPED